MIRSIGKWKLPQPTDIKEENEWIPIPRIARTVPFGYKQDDEDYPTAAKEMLDSRWATQVKGRAVKLSNAMHNGEF